MMARGGQVAGRAPNGRAAAILTAHPGHSRGVQAALASFVTGDEGFEHATEEARRQEAVIVTHHRLQFLAFPMRTRGGHPPVKPETSRFPCKELPHMPGSLTPPERQVLALSHRPVLPSVLSITSASGLKTFSRLNGWPMHSLANDLPPSSQMTPHDSRASVVRSLYLHCKRLSLSTLCRFRRRTDNILYQPDPGLRISRPDLSRKTVLISCPLLS